MLRAEEIECRAAAVSEKGVSLLLYKDARVDQRILDETFGPFGWKRNHQCIDGSLYCTVEIYDPEKKEWIAKQDVGNMGAREKEKSQASDSFKRACFNWGIGRELYSAPFIWVPACNADIRKKDGKYYCASRFRVHSITYGREREITGLAVADGEGRIVYELKAPGNTAAGNAAGGVNAAGSAGKPAGSGTAARAGRAAGNTNAAGGIVKPSRSAAPAGNTLSGAQMDSLEAELHRTGVGMDAVRQRYGIQNPGQMPQELYERVMKALAKTRSSDAA